MRQLSILALCACAAISPSLSAKGFVDVNLYPYLSDVDGDWTMTTMAFQTLPNRFHYLGFVNMGSKTGDKGELNKYYSEQNIRYKLSDSSAFDLTAQFNFRTGDDNDRHRLGVRWRLNDSGPLSSFFSAIGTQYAINLHAIQFDHEDADVWQLEHTFKTVFPCFNKKLYLSGFVDHTFNEDLAPGMPDSPIVGEVQLGYQLSKRWFAIAEYRVNQYRRSDVNNMTAGVEYKYTW